MKKIIISVLVLGLLGLTGLYFSSGFINSKASDEVRYALIDADVEEFISYEDVTYNFFSKQLELKHVTLYIDGFFKKKLGLPQNLVQRIEFESIKTNIIDFKKMPDDAYLALDNYKINVNFATGLAGFLREYSYSNQIINGDEPFKGSTSIAIKTESNEATLTLKNTAVNGISSDIEIVSDYYTPIIDFYNSIDFKNPLQSNYNNLDILFGDTRIKKMAIHLKDNGLYNRLNDHYKKAQWVIPGEKAIELEITENMLIDLRESLTDQNVSAKKAEEYSKAIVSAFKEGGELNVESDLKQSEKIDTLMNRLDRQSFIDVLNVSF